MKIRITLLSLFLMFGWIATDSINAVGADERRERGKRSRQRKADTAPKVGDIAPLFTLEAQDGKSKTTLADFKGKKPVVLFFGSYT